jgi:ferric-dicitrate binding protein FerR (iron transport regulator)
MLVLQLSNGAAIELDGESEVELDEFGQMMVTGNLKISELKEEPTVSRTRLRLVRGAVTIEVKPLKVARGSSFVLGTPAGNVRTAEGKVRSLVRMSDLGLGICSVELLKGKAEWEPPGGAYAPLPAGRNFTYAIEIEKKTGAIKVGELLPPVAPKP